MAEEPDETLIDPSPPPAAPSRKWRPGGLFLYAFLVLWALVALWNLFKPLPAGTRVRGEVVDIPINHLQFLADVSGADVFGAPVVHQQIFDAMLKMIGEANEYLVLDFHLFNERRDTEVAKAHRSLSIELRDALLKRKREVPALHVLVIADGVNELYGGMPSRIFSDLRGAGIDVVSLDLDPLRDSNPIYSAFWRITTKWWAGKGSADAWMPNPLDAGPAEVSFGAWARLLNFKADQRKVILGDDGHGGITGILTSANPHDASSMHSNVGLKVSGAALLPLLQSELTLARGSGWTGDWAAPQSTDAPAPSPDKAAHVQVLTEGEIGAVIERNFASTRVGDSIDIAMFQLADRSVVQALIAAAKRGVEVRVILDPNKDSFGNTRNGIPNRSVATELAGASDGAIKVRWFRTHGEQFHTKLVAIRTSNEFWFTLGSADLTRRSLEDFNLEANIGASVSPNAEVATSIANWYEMLWTNHGPPDLEYTSEFGAYADPSQGTYWLYRLMEASGLCTF